MVQAAMSRRETIQTAKFLRQIRELPPEERRRLLEDMRDYGKNEEKQIRDLLASTLREIARARRRGCSMPLIDAVNDRGEEPTIAGMTRGRGRVRIGDAEGTIPSRRLTPRVAVRDEDRYDGMSTFEATICRDPPSSSAVQLELIRSGRFGFERQRIKEGKEKKSRKRSQKPGRGNAE